MKKTLKINFINNYLPPQDAYVELKNAKIVDVINAAYFDPKVRLILKGRRIEAMPGMDGEPSNIKPDFVIDLKGKTILPGLFNTHCHTTLTSPSLLPDLSDVKGLKAHAEKQMEKNMTECLAHGITNIRDAWAADLRKVRTLCRRIQKNELPGPRIMQSVAVGPSGGYLTEKYGWVMKRTRSLLGAPSIDYKRAYSGTVEFPVNATEQQVRGAVDRAIDERGAQSIKIGEQRENSTNFKPDATIMTQGQLTAIADQARKRNLKSTIHHLSTDSFRRALKAGVSSLAHIACDAPLTEEDIARFLSQACMLEPTMSVAYDMSYKIKGEPTRDDPYLTALSQVRNRIHDDIVENYWIPEYQGGARCHHHKLNNEITKVFGILSIKALFKNTVSYCTTGVRNLRMLYGSGVPISISNDGGIPPCTLAMVRHEINLLHLFLNHASHPNVFSGADALRMATINGATCLGLERDFGSIETGKVADLIVMAGDPLNDYRLVGSPVAALFKDGRLVIDNCKLQVSTANKV